MDEVNKRLILVLPTMNTRGGGRQHLSMCVAGNRSTALKDARSELLSVTQALPTTPRSAVTFFRMPKPLNGNSVTILELYFALRALVPSRRACMSALEMRTCD